MSNFKYLPRLISVNSMKNILKLRDVTHRFRIIDANMGRITRKDYDRSHIENSIYVDTLNCTTPSKLYPRDIPDKKCFEEYMSSQGVSNSHHLIVYDRSEYGFYSAARMWWLCKYFGHSKVSVLNGGFNKWLAAGGDVTAKKTNFEPEMFKVNEDLAQIRTYEQVAKNVQTQEEILIDARPADAFMGTKSDIVPGHIRRSLNIPYEDLFDKETMTLKGSEELREMFSNQTDDKTDSIIASSLVGTTAAALALALKTADYRYVSVYCGSWTEFSQKATADLIESPVSESTFKTAP